MSKELLERTANGENHSISFEAFANTYDLGDTTLGEIKENGVPSRNYVIKFTTSFYHENTSYCCKY